MNKYNAVKTEIDGIRFDSKREAEYYQQLKSLEQAGHITDLVIHPRYEILPGYMRDGRKVRAAYYYADFSYYDMNLGVDVVVEVKGKETDLYRLKRKMFELSYPGLRYEVVK